MKFRISNYEIRRQIMMAKISKRFDIFVLIICWQISTLKKPMIKTSNSIEINLWRMKSK